MRVTARFTCIKTTFPQCGRVTVGSDGDLGTVALVGLMMP